MGVDLFESVIDEQAVVVGEERRKKREEIKMDSGNGSTGFQANGKCPAKAADQE